ncbi:MAG: 6-phosphogluconolactonase [Sphaerochaetaceae bacterium]
MNIERINSTKDLEIAIREDLYSLSREKSGSLYLALPGGRSAGYLVKALLTLPKDVLVRTHLFLIDERLEGERNEDTLMKAGLKTALDKGTTLSIVQEDIPLSEHPFDRLYLGIGEDGHVASLFPGSLPGETKKQTMVISDSPKPPKRRVTLSYQGFLDLAKEAKVYLLFIGESKRDALQRLLSGMEEVQTLPCAFFARSPFHGTIVTDLRENTT